MKQGALAGLGAPLLAGSIASAAQNKDTATALLKVAVLTGGHPYDVPSFHKLFRTLEGVDAYIQSVEDFVFTPEAARDQYDVVLSYHMLTQGPADGPYKAAFEHFGATDQGIVLLHHAILAYPAWPLWSDLVGIANRKFWFYHDQPVKMQVANTQHPITRGLQSWEMIDETYTMADAGEGSEVLLKVDQPNSMKTIGWTRQFKKSRVFCLESGHDNQTWVNANFREVLRRGILWTARRL